MEPVAIVLNVACFGYIFSGKRLVTGAGRVEPSFKEAKFVLARDALVNIWDGC